jgi:hypothetical protein
MVQSVRVLGFQPNINGLHFDNNNWPKQRPAYFVYAFGQKVLNLGDAHSGYCGGMTFTVKDLFEARLLPPADTVPPAMGTPLRDYINARSLDSFTEVNVTHFLAWIQLLDHDTAVWGHGLPWFEITAEWPQIKTDLDSNRVSPLGLVHGQKPPFYGNFSGIPDLGDCHQVLAWGYDLDGSNLTIYIYDPDNLGNDDTITKNWHAQTTPRPLRYLIGMMVNIVAFSGCIMHTTARRRRSKS